MPSRTAPSATSSAAAGQRSCCDAATTVISSPPNRLARPKAVNSAPGQSIGGGCVTRSGGICVAISASATQPSGTLSRKFQRHDA